VKVKESSPYLVLKAYHLFPFYVFFSYLFVSRLGSSGLILPVLATQ